MFVVFIFLIFFGVFFFFLFFFLNFFLSYKGSFFLGMSSFESGFDSIGKIQNTFSVHFFLIMFLFIVFDLEIVILLGFLVSGSFSFFFFFFIFFFLVFGLYLEWFFNKLVWSF